MIQKTGVQKSLEQEEYSRSVLFMADCGHDVPAVGQTGPSVFKTWRIVGALSGAFTPAPDAGFDTATVTAL